MNDYNTEDGTFCYFHPNQEFVGVCPFCLNEKLLLLTSNQKSQIHSNKIKTPINIPKILAFESLLNRFQFRHRKSPADGDDSDHEASASQEDSFILINFEENGAAKWEKGTVSQVSLDRCSLPWNRKSKKEIKPEDSKTIIKHAKNRTSLRLHKRISNLLQLIRLKRSSMANGYPARTKVGRTWITRSLNKRSTEA